jgi:hypothetical protein
MNKLLNSSKKEPFPSFTYAIPCAELSGHFAVKQPK